MADTLIQPTTNERILSTTVPTVTRSDWFGSPVSEEAVLAMPTASEAEELDGVVNRLLDALAGTVSSHVGPPGAVLRQQIGSVRAGYIEMLADGTFADELLSCFTQSREAGATLLRMAAVRQAMVAEKTVYAVSTTIVQTAIFYCLSAESRMITAITFTSRDDVEKMLAVMKIAFDDARGMAADEMDSASYQAIIYLQGTLTQYLATTARPLPRMIVFNLARNFPALAVSNRIYQDPTRWEEIAAENKTIHPAFMPRQIIGLSA